MGIPFSNLRKMEELGLFAGKRMSVLDIGSSNLYSAQAQEIKNFVVAHAPGLPSDLDQFADRLAAGSGYDPVKGGLNGSFVGELFEKAGMEYVSLDIAAGYKTTILDLNRNPLPSNFKSRFDLVLNFGTTEHILNQFNCFKVIHEATKVGGYIHHSLPALGYVDHGYITYTARCFFDIAGYNEYDVVDFWFDGPGGENDIFAAVRSYKSYFPVLQRALDEIGTSVRGNSLSSISIPDVSINIVYRKTSAKPFWGALESSTSVGGIPADVTSNYATPGVASSTPSQAATGEPRARSGIFAALERVPVVSGIAARALEVLRRPAASVNPHPEIKLSGEARALRDRFVVGRASLDECFRLYELMTAAKLDFPLDWEQSILRATINRYPDRQDLQSRLSLVTELVDQAADDRVRKEAAAPQAMPVANGEKTLQETVVRFRKRQLVGIEDRKTLVEQYEGVFRDAVSILGSEHFCALPLEHQVDIVTAIYNTVVSGSPREASTIGDLIGWHFIRLLRVSEVDDVSAFRLYDVLYGLYFMGASHLGDMKKFDTVCVGPFEEYLMRRFQQRNWVPAQRRLDKDVRNICYFFHCAHFERGNAVAPMFVALAKAHAKAAGRKVFAYCIQWVSDDFLQAFADSDVTVRTFRQDNAFNRLDEVLESMRADAIDVAITELNSSIATYLFLQRCAPIQIWIDTGYPFWSISAVDWVLLPGKDYQTNFGVRPDRFSYLTVRQELPAALPQVPQSALDDARASLPASAFVFATFVRLSKITPAFLAAVRKILNTNAAAHLLIVGTGDPRLVYEFVALDDVKNQVTFIHRNVDLNVYGRIVDVFIDTFPFIGGNACREVAIHGKPVLALKTPDWERLLLVERDPALLAPDTESFVNIATRLATDKEFYNARAEDAVRIARKTSRMEEMVSDVERAIGSVMQREPRG